MKYRPVRAVDLLGSLAIILLLIGAMGYFAPGERNDPVWPWFVGSGVLGVLSMFLAIFEEE